MKKCINIETSKTGLKIPQIDNIYLHSTLDPIKEAEAFAKTQIKRIEHANNVIILGLGFGYHVKELQKLATASNLKIKFAVIEPNTELVDLYLQQIDSTPNFDIISNQDVVALYQERSFFEILKHKPIIISHNNSFNANKNFFTSLLSYRASQQVLDYADRVEDQNFKTYLQSVAGESDTIENILDRITQSRKISTNDKLLLAFSQITGRQSRTTGVSQ
jgi:hypothetical protein